MSKLTFYNKNNIISVRNDILILKEVLPVKLYGTENNEIIMKELGKRIQDMRISMDLTQTEMADQSGVALRTVARIENGESVKVESVLNVLRVLKVLPNIDLLLQEQILAPTEMVDYGRKRKRVSSKKKIQEKKTWVWGDEEG